MIKRRAKMLTISVQTIQDKKYQMRKKIAPSIPLTESYSTTSTTSTISTATSTAASATTAIFTLPPLIPRVSLAHKRIGAPIKQSHFRARESIVAKEKLESSSCPDILLCLLQ